MARSRSFQKSRRAPAAVLGILNHRRVVEKILDRNTEVEISSPDTSGANLFHHKPEEQQLFQVSIPIRSGTAMAVVMMQGGVAHIEPPRVWK